MVLARRWEERRRRRRQEEEERLRAEIRADERERILRANPDLDIKMPDDATEQAV